MDIKRRALSTPATPNTVSGVPKSVEVSRDATLLPMSSRPASARPRQSGKAMALFAAQSAAANPLGRLEQQGWRPPPQIFKYCPTVRIGSLGCTGR
jgi:hypothetical protein